MKFIREMILKKTKSATLSEAVDADLQELRQAGNENSANVPNFGDLVADIAQPNIEEAATGTDTGNAEVEITEADEKILSIFENDKGQDEDWDDEDWDDEEDWEQETAKADVPETVLRTPERDDDFSDSVDEDIIEEIEADVLKSFSAPDVEPEIATQKSDEFDAKVDVDPPVEITPELVATAPSQANQHAAAPKIWDLQPEPQEEPMTQNESKPQIVDPVVVQVPAAAIGRSSRRAGRVKTRLLGFEHSGDVSTDPFSDNENTNDKHGASFPVGWIVVTQGPGRGASFSLFNGVSQIGRGEDQAVKLDFGDTSISRSNHAAIAYDNEQSNFFLGHGGKANLVRLNGRPVLSTEELSSGDLIRIGESTLRFVALCGAEFDWERDNQENGDDVAFA